MQVYSNVQKLYSSTGSALRIHFPSSFHLSVFQII